MEGRSKSKWDVDAKPVVVVDSFSIPYQREELESFTHRCRSTNAPALFCLFLFSPISCCQFVTQRAVSIYPP